MKQIRLLGCGTLRIALFLLLGWSAYFPMHATATDMPVIGGLNAPGKVERFECPKGSYLVGLKGKHGDWIDRLAPVCAPWLPAEQRFGKTVVGPLFGKSIGGKETPTHVCWRSGVRNQAVQSWRYYFQYLKTPRHYVLSFIQAHCVSLSPRAETGGLKFGPLPHIVWPKQGPFEGPPPNQACPPGEIAVGIRARTDLYNHYIYGIGLICGPPPSLGEIATQVNPLVRKPVPPAATKVNPLATAPVPSADMFTITNPKWTNPLQSIQQGQLFVKATPPKIGMTPVSELRFEWLDAPPDWCGKPKCRSYVNQFPIDTAPLLRLEGYQVDQPVTRGHTGKWEVSVRASGKAVPGPWSFPVRFHLFLTQPTQSQKQSPPVQQTSPLPSSSIVQPSPVPQTAPLPSSSVTQPPPMQQPAPPPPSSVMQAPASSSSAPAQMNRSSSMFTTRGVEDKKAGSEAATQKGPAKTP